MEFFRFIEDLCKEIVSQKTEIISLRKEVFSQRAETLKLREETAAIQTQFKGMGTAIEERISAEVISVKNSSMDVKMRIEVDRVVKRMWTDLRA